MDPNNVKQRLVLESFKREWFLRLHSYFISTSSHESHSLAAIPHLYKRRKWRHKPSAVSVDERKKSGKVPRLIQVELSTCGVWCDGNRKPFVVQVAVLFDKETEFGVKWQLRTWEKDMTLYRVFHARWIRLVEFLTMTQNKRKVLMLTWFIKYLI
jgi:hypothetical protein